MNEKMYEIMRDGRGVIAALDQSGGSSAKTLKNYGIDESQYSSEEEMFNLIHEMRKRVMQNATLSVALMKILDTKGIPTDKCVIPSNLPQYAINEKGDATNE